MISRRGCSLPAIASGVDTHRASISSRVGQGTEELRKAWKTLVYRSAMDLNRAPNNIERYTHSSSVDIVLRFLGQVRI
jgi:hypothetical protein